jgi:DNA-binding response OmpR family regulator
MQILLIEDDQVDARAIRGMLQDTSGSQCDITHVGRLSDGLEKLVQDGIDVVLLDLGLPDSQGLEALNQLRAQTPGVPVIVLTGADSETLALGAVQYGAEDYLIKGQVDGRSLMRSMHYAIERRRLLQELEDSQQREQRERELRMLERAVPTAQSPATAGAFAQMTLQEGNPHEFREMVGQYKTLIMLALEQRTFKVEHDLSGQLRSLAERLGFLRAVPRDVVEVHSAAVKSKSTESPSQKTQACREEAQFMLLELMEYLCSFYRRYSTGVMIGNPPGPAAKTGQDSTAEETVK